jgi:hypothetical protein
MYTILNKNSSVPTAQRKWNTEFVWKLIQSQKRSILIDKIVNKLYTPVEPFWIKDSSFKSSVNRVKKDIMQKEYHLRWLIYILLFWLRSPHGSGDSFSTIVNGRIFLCHQLI